MTRLIAGMMALGLSASLAHAELTVEEAETGWSVLADGKLLCASTSDEQFPKPWFDPVNTLAGHNLVLSSPPDHPHHRGLMFAWGNVGIEGEADDYHLIFWGEAEGDHHHGKILPDPDGEPRVWVEADTAHIEADYIWTRNTDDLLILRERRELRIHPSTDGRGYLLTWITEQTPEMNIRIGPTPGRDVCYYGFGIRSAPDMDLGMFENSNGGRDVTGCHGDLAEWVAYVGPNEPVRGFAMFDHPDNPRYPTGWFAMNAFGYLTAALPAYEEYPLAKGDTLKLTYGVLAFDGAMDAGYVDDQYDAWLKLVPAENERVAPRSADALATSRDGRVIFAPDASPAKMKPSYHPVTTPSGFVVTDGRNAQPHHHALWLTWGKVELAGGERVDFWAENGAPGATGRIVTETLDLTQDGDASVYDSTHLWRRAAGEEPFIREERNVRVETVGDRATLITIATDQTALEDLTLLKEGNEAVSYFGLDIQMPPDMHNGLMLNSNGSTGRAGVEGEPATWCAYSTTVTPARGVAILDHPSNPRHPNTYFTLPTGFLGTSLVALEDYSLEAGETLSLTYGVLVFEGDAEPKFISKQYRRWAR